MNKLIPTNHDRNVVYQQISHINYEAVELTGRWKIATEECNIYLYLEIKTKAFWTKYKYKWIPDYMLKTVDDEELNIYYQPQEFINDCNA